MLPIILRDREGKIALEEIAKQDTVKFLRRSKSKKVLDQAVSYALAIGFSNAAGALIGGLAEGLEGAVEGMKQTSASIVPGLLLMKTISDVYLSRNFYNDANKVVEKLRQGFTQMLTLSENKTLAAIHSVEKVVAAGGFYYLLSHLGEAVTGTEINNRWMMGVGAIVGLFNSTNTMGGAKKLRQRILNYEDGPEEIKEIAGEELDYNGLERIVDFALSNPGKTGEIYLATSEKKFRGIDGALGYLGAIDALSDNMRDSTRIRPNVTLKIDNSSIFRESEGSPKFAFNVKMQKSKTDVLLNLVQLLGLRNDGTELDIHPRFSEAALGDFMANPYDHIRGITIYGEKGENRHFIFEYNFEDANDSVEITINSREQLGIVAEVFRQLYRRPLITADFDTELVGLSKEATIVPEKFGIDNLADGEMNWVEAICAQNRARMEKCEREEPEKMTKETGYLAQKLLEIYGAEKENIQGAQGYPSIGVAFNGALFSIEPYQETARRTGLVSKILSVPAKFARSLLGREEFIPDARKVSAYTQISEVDKNNVYDVTRELTAISPELKVKPQFPSFTYGDFWKLQENPELIAKNSGGIELLDAEGARILLKLGESKKESFATVRDKDFPNREIIEERLRLVEEVRERNLKNFREYSDKRRTGEDLKFEREFCEYLDQELDMKRELKKPSYKIVPADGNNPGYTVSYCSDNESRFRQNSTVEITTNDNVWIERTTTVERGVEKVARYLSNLKTAIERVNSAR